MEKICKICQTVKPVREFYRAICMEYKREQQRIKYSEDKKNIENMPPKKCLTCDIVKSIGEFGLRQARCKECKNNTYYRTYRENHGDVIKKRREHKTICECGETYTNYDHLRHYDTNHHQTYLLLKRAGVA